MFSLTWLILVLLGTADGLVWTQTSPTFSTTAVGNGVVQFKDTIVLCSPRGLQATTSAFTAPHVVSGTIDCPTLVSGPSGFLVSQDSGDWLTSTDGRHWVKAPVNVSSPIGSPWTSSSGQKYYVCGATSAGQSQYRCAFTESPTTHWTYSPMLTLPEVGVFFSNDTAILVTSTFFDRGVLTEEIWQLDVKSLVLSWSQIARRTIPFSKRYALPQVRTSNGDGWLLQNYTTTQNTTFLWTNDFKSYKSGFFPKKLSGLTQPCYSDNTLVTVSFLDFTWARNRLAFSPTPLVTASWKEVGLAPFPAQEGAYALTCLSSGVLLHTPEGGLVHGSLQDSAMRFHQINNGVTGYSTASYLLEDSVYVLVEHGKYVWKSSNSGTGWTLVDGVKNPPVKIIHMHKHIVDGETHFLGTNYTHVFTTNDFKRYTVNFAFDGFPQLPPGDWYPFDGLQAVTVYKGLIVGVWYLSWETGFKVHARDFIATTPWPLTATSKWTTCWNSTNISPNWHGKHRIAADDKAEVVWVRTNNVLLYSNDGIHWHNSTMQLNSNSTVNDVVEGMAAGNGKLYAVINHYGTVPPFQNQYKIYNLTNTGLVKEVWRLSLQVGDFQFIPELAWFAWRNIYTNTTAVGYTGSNFRTVNHTTLLPTTFGADPGELGGVNVHATQTHVVAVVFGHNHPIITTAPLNQQ